MKQSEEYRSRHSMEVPGKSTEVPGKSTEVPGKSTEVSDNCQELPWSRKKSLYGCKQRRLLPMVHLNVWKNSLVPVMLLIAIQRSYVSHLLRCAMTVVGITSDSY